jgi:general secretion pathway protein A
MYVQHFKFKKRPFINGLESEVFLPSGESDLVIARLQNVMLAHDGAALITGGPGVGKSTLIAEALKGIADKVMLANIDLRQTDPCLIYEMALLSLGGQPGEGSAADLLHRLRQTIAKHNANGRKVTAVIDINGFTVERANHILRLSHLANQPGGQLNIVLFGPHSLHRLLDTPGLIHIRQRIGFRFRVRPLTVAETGEYVQRHIAAVKGKSENVLADGIAKTVYCYVGGVPRLINTLMDASLGHAFAQKLSTVTADTINEVAKDLGWKPLSRGLAEPPEAKASPTPAPAPKAAEPARRRKDVAGKPAEAQPAAKAEKKAENPAAKKAEKPAAKKAEKAAGENPDHVKTGLIFEQPLEIMAETEEPVHEGLSVADATDGARSDKNEEPGELTQQLLVAAQNLDVDIEESPAEESLPGVPAEDSQAAVDLKGENADPVESGPPPGVPAMEAADTSATGMLRLEDLDARFAETVFGDDEGMLAAMEELNQIKES